MRDDIRKHPFPLSMLTLLALTSGIIPGALAAPGDLSVSGEITANTFSGDGSGLTNLPASEVYESTILVSPVGSESQNGQTLVNALSSVPGPRDASNPILVKIEPGIYDISNAGVVSIDMEDHVDLEGSGIGVTTIQGSQSTVMNLDSNSELRYLTLKNIKGSSFATGIQIDNGGTPTITHVAVHSDAGDSYNGSAINVNGGAQPVIQNSFLRATGDTAINTLHVLGDANPHVRRSVIETECASGCNAVNVQDAYIQVEDSVIESTDDGFFSYDGGSGLNYDLYIDHSSISGQSNAIDMFGDNIDLFVGASKVVGNVSTYPTLTCVRSYDGNYQELDSQCQ